MAFSGISKNSLVLFLLKCDLRQRGSFNFSFSCFVLMVFPYSLLLHCDMLRILLKKKNIFQQNSVKRKKKKMNSEQRCANEQNIQDVPSETSDSGLQVRRDVFFLSSFLYSDIKNNVSAALNNGENDCSSPRVRGQRESREFTSAVNSVELLQAEYRGCLQKSSAEQFFSLSLSLILHNLQVQFFFFLEK